MHKPNISIDRLIAVQRKISDKAIKTINMKLTLIPRRALGLDAAYSKTYGGVAVAALVELVGSQCRLVEYSVAVGEPALDYIPGLLAFREAALFYTALEGLERKDYDVVVVDGHGISHPRYAGIATHIGLALARPSIGVAKKKLYGNTVYMRNVDECSDFPCIIGEIRDGRRSSFRLAYIVIPRRGDKSPIYVSPGAYIGLEEAYKIVSMMVKVAGTKLPCPTHHADRISKKIARGLDRGLVSINELRRDTNRTLDSFISG